MEARKNITAKEREFIAAVEAHRNAEGKVIAWGICANGNGKVIFENATKDRYSCAHVIDMEGGYFLLFVGERAGHPYDRKTYKRKGNALKGFKMQEGHNEPLTFAATASETPQISTEAAETVNVSVEGENAEKTPVFSSREEVITYLDKTHGIEYDAGEVMYLKDGCCAEEHADGSEWCIYRNEDSDECVETVRIAPQSPETPQRVECTTDTPEPRETAQKRPNRAIGSAQVTRRDTLSNTLRPVICVTRECSTTEAAYW